MEFFACKRVLFRFKASHYLYIRINLPGHQDFRIFLERDIVRYEEVGGSILVGDAQIKQNPLLDGKGVS